MKIERIKHRQAAWIISAILLSGGLITFPRELVRISGKDAWTCFVLPFMFAFLIIYLYTRMMKYKPGKHIFSIVTDSFGTIIGNGINLILILYFWMLLSRDITSLSFFLNSTILTETPREMIIWLLGPVLLYYGKLGFEPVARVNDFSLPFMVVILIFLPLLVSNEIKPELLMPTFTGDPHALLYGNVANLGWVGDLFVIGSFLHKLQDGAKTRVYLRIGTVVGMALLVMGIFLNLCVMGPNITGRVLYPYHVMVEQIQITDFMDRLETLIYVLWFPVYFVNTAVFAIALFVGFSHLANNVHYRQFSGVTSWLIVITSVFAYNSIIELTNFINYSLTFIVLFVITPIIVITLLRLMWMNANSSQAKPNSPRKPYNIWTYVSHGLVFLFAVIVIIGQTFALDMPTVGTVGMIAVALVILGLVVCTFLEWYRYMQEEKYSPSHDKN